MNSLFSAATLAMVRKELRSVLRWTPLGMILIGVLVAIGGWENVGDAGRME